MTKRRFGMIVRSRWLTIIVVVVITGALVLMAMRLWGPGSATAAVAAVGIVARIWIEWFQRDEVRREESSQSVLGCCVLTGDGRLPRISDITDLTLLGVHPAPAEGSASFGMPRMPPYVNRDVDALLRRRMATAGFVLLVGDSTAGKTRTAAEAVATALPAHTLIAPVGREGLAEAVSYAARRHASVLWLDDLEGYWAGNRSPTRSCPSSCAARTSPMPPGPRGASAKRKPNTSPSGGCAPGSSARSTRTRSPAGTAWSTAWTALARAGGHRARHGGGASSTIVTNPTSAA